jgi:site-specific recombinase XerD
MSESIKKHPLVTQYVEEYSKQRNWSAHYKHLNEQIVNHALKIIEKEPQDIDVEDINGFFYRKKETQCFNTYSSVTNNYWALRLFFQFLKEKNIIAEVPKFKVTSPKLKVHLDYESLKDVRRQKRFVNRGNLSDRDRTIWKLAYTSFINIKDIAKIKVKNLKLNYNMIDLDAEDITENDIPYLYISDEAVQAIKQYRIRTVINNEYLFFTKNNLPLTALHIRIILANIAKRAGVEKPIGGLRGKKLLTLKTAIEAGVDLLVIKKLFNIKSMKKFDEIFKICNIRKIRPMKEARKYHTMMKQRSIQ